MLYELLRTAACPRGDRVAFVNDGRTVSYGQLLSAVDGFAASLDDLGVEPGHRVALRLPNSAEFAVALFAVSRCGGAVLLLDSALKEAEAWEYARRAGARFLFCGGNTGTPEGPPAGMTLVSVPVIGEGEGSTASSPRDVPPTLRPENSVAVLLLSSGTAGPAKIVPKTVAQARAALEIFRGTVPYAEEDRILAVLPFCHSFGFFNVLLAGLASGACLHISRYSPRVTAETIARDRLSVLPATPFMFRMMAEIDFEPLPDFSAVRVAISAGAALPKIVLDNVRDSFGITVRQSYGTTETGPVALARGDESGTERPGSVGRPYAGVAIQIRDSEGNPLPPDCEGEVAVQSAAQTAGYLTAEGVAEASCFRGRWVLTGDVGLLDSATGELVICGRRKRMINVAGKKVAPDEVESCLLTHPGVADVLVVAERTEAGAERVLAYVVRSPAAGTGGDSASLRTYCAQHLADYKIPRRIEFVQRLERGAMGKVPHWRRPGEHGGEQRYVG